MYASIKRNDLSIEIVLQPYDFGYLESHNGSLGSFGWTGGLGTWAEADPDEGISIVYMHNMRPNEELYHHHRVRTAAYARINY